MKNQELDEVLPQPYRRSWYKRRDILFVFFVSLLWLASHVYGQVTGPTRISEALSQALDKNPKNVDLLITSNFPPERFHSNVYNTIGVQRGTKGKTTLLVRVSPSNVRWISRKYWVDQIDLAVTKK